MTDYDGKYARPAGLGALLVLSAGGGSACKREEALLLANATYCGGVKGVKASLIDRLTLTKSRHCGYLAEGLLSHSSDRPNRTDR